MHGRQNGFACWPWYHPAGQSLHSFCPPKSWYFALVQFLQDVSSMPSIWYRPVLHWEHVVRSKLLKYLSKHFPHVAVPSAAAVKPRGHLSQVVRRLLTLVYSPTWHGSQTNWSVLEGLWNCPGGQQKRSPWLFLKSVDLIFPSHGLNSSEHHVRLNDVADLNMLLVAATLETSHFETSELNALALWNTAELKKKRERIKQEKWEDNRDESLNGAKKKKKGEGFWSLKERSRWKEKKIDTYCSPC